MLRYMSLQELRTHLRLSQHGLAVATGLPRHIIQNFEAYGEALSEEAGLHIKQALEAQLIKEKQRLKNVTKALSEW